MKRLRILTLCSIILAFSIFFLKKNDPATIAVGKGLVVPKRWLKANPNPVTPQKDRRPADQTFLTFPEWYLVFSPEEQAHYFRQHTATSFPFMKHTSQIWESYSIVNDQIKGNFPPNPGYHFMIKVIGTSATVEYAIKAWYELLIGRITDTYTPKTTEDKFNARFTQEYVDFIKEYPWYEFNFKQRLKQLWGSVPINGSNWVRKIDRRYILTSELSVKWVYGQLIKMGTKTIYEEALPETIVLADHLPANQVGIKILKQFVDGTALLSMPRYDRFSASAQALSIRGVHFKEIAGNTSCILLTVFMKAAKDSNIPGAQTVFIQPITSSPTLKRVALAIPVAQLHELIVTCRQQNIEIEHIFDY